MAEPTQTKVLVFGAIDSKASLNAAITKANKLHGGNNGPFGLFAFFAESREVIFGEGESLDTSDITIPDLPSYLLVNNGDVDGPKYGHAISGKDGEQDGNERDDFLILLDGKLTLLQSTYGLLKTKSGISIAWFGSTGNVHDSEDRSAVYQAINFIKKNAPVDILLTRFYPNWITRGTVLCNNMDSETSNMSSNTNEPKENTKLKAHMNKCQDTTLFARAALPRYTFVSYTRDPYRRPRNDQEKERNSLFWERLPYYTALPNPAGENEPQPEEDKLYTLSRFISLAPFDYKPDDDTPKKLVRYHYLFVSRLPHPAPLSLASIAPQGSTSTPTPFFQDKKRKRQNHMESVSSHKRNRHTEVVVSPENCFLCLSSSRIEKHMIASIADESYITLARGPLFLPGGRHVMIVPLAHVPTLGALEIQEFKNVVTERAKYMESLCQLYLGSESSAEGVLKSQLVVSFEISRSKNVHCHAQVVAFPAGSVQQLVDAFKEATEKFGYQAFDEYDEEMNDYGKDSLKICIYSSSDGEDSKNYFKKCLVLCLDDTEMRFNLQFPRKVLAEYAMQQPGYEEDRSNWKDCTEDLESETKSTEQLKELFKPFDFTQ